MTDTLPPLLPPGGDIVPLKDSSREAPPSGGRKGGAPHGNKNALKHGFYSHTFSRQEINRLDNDVEGEFRDEEKYLARPDCPHSRVG